MRQHACGLAERLVDTALAAWPQGKIRPAETLFKQCRAVGGRSPNPGTAETMVVLLPGAAILPAFASVARPPLASVLPLFCGR